MTLELLDPAQEVFGVRELPSLVLLHQAVDGGGPVSTQGASQLSMCTHVDYAMILLPRVHVYLVPSRRRCMPPAGWRQRLGFRV